MRTLKMKQLFYKFIKSILLILLAMVLSFSLFVVSIIINQKVIHKNLRVFSEQLFSFETPQNTTVLNHFRAVGCTSGMGDNRIYCAILMLESPEGKEKLQQHYTSAQFHQSQNKGLFDQSVPTPQIHVFPISEWNSVRAEFENIEDDTAFLVWELQKYNKNCFLVFLTDGPYHSMVGENPYFEIHNLSN
ncbi:MAG: hypothetical protein ACERKO_09965 [Acetanaerobacterium sp.]